MKKINTLFVVDRATSLATQEVDPRSAWVLTGEGIATIKFDGEAAMIKDGKLYKRWNRKLTKKSATLLRKSGGELAVTLDMFKDLPEGAIALEDGPAPVTLHFPYWIPVVEGDNSNKIYFEALSELGELLDGTYELIGEKVQSNAHGITGHRLIKHGSETIEISDYSFDGLRGVLEQLNSEGIVWHHPDGRMAKLRRSHFNLHWREDVRDKR